MENAEYVIEEVYLHESRGWVDLFAYAVKSRGDSTYPFHQTFMQTWGQTDDPHYDPQRVLESAKQQIGSKLTVSGPFVHGTEWLKAGASDMRTSFDTVVYK